MGQMKIGMMVRSFIPFPRPKDIIYAPIDLAIATAKGLGKKGHHVTLFAPIGSEVHGENVHVETSNLRPLVHNIDEWGALLDDTDKIINGQVALWDAYMVHDMFKRARAGEFDMLVFHHIDTGMLIAREYPDVKCVFILHDPIFSWRKELLELYSSPNVRFVSISNNQRHDAPDLPYLATVYNGTDIDMFSPSYEMGEYLLFTGRIHPSKGVKEAIEVARRTEHKLLIIGPPDHGSTEYFEQHIKHELDDQILYLGAMEQAQLKTYYQKAKALLTPVQWEEPFGLTTIESMASGTPVISLKRGAAPEIIKDGETGFICDSIHGMAEAVAKIGDIDRKACRRHVEKNFSYTTMVDSYEKAFCELLQRAKPQTPRVVVRKFGKKIAKVRRLVNPKNLR